MSDVLHLRLPATSPHVRAIDNRARTVTICLDEDSVQEPTRCECLHDHHNAVCHDPGALMRLRPRACRSARLKRAVLRYQVALAKKAKMQQPYIAQLETGVEANPTLDTLRRLAKALKVPADELVG